MVDPTHISNRLAAYFNAKNRCENPAKVERAILTCREWLKWAKWFRLQQSVRYEIYKGLKSKPGHQLTLF